MSYGRGARQGCRSNFGGKIRTGEHGIPSGHVPKIAEPATRTVAYRKIGKQEPLENK